LQVTPEKLGPANVEWRGGGFVHANHSAPACRAMARERRRDRPLTVAGSTPYFRSATAAAAFE